MSTSHIKQPWETEYHGHLMGVDGQSMYPKKKTRPKW